MIVSLWIIFGILIGLFFSIDSPRKDAQEKVKYMFMGILGVLSGLSLSYLWLGIPITYFSFISLAVVFWVTSLLFFSIRLFDNLLDLLVLKISKHTLKYRHNISNTINTNHLIQDIKDSLEKSSFEKTIHSIVH